MASTQYISNSKEAKKPLLLKKDQNLGLAKQNDKSDAKFGAPVVSVDLFTSQGFPLTESEVGSMVGLFSTLAKMSAAPKGEYETSPEDALQAFLDVNQHFSSEYKTLALQRLAVPTIKIMLAKLDKREIRSVIVDYLFNKLQAESKAPVSPELNANSRSTSPIAMMASTPAPMSILGMLQSSGLPPLHPQVATSKRGVAVAVAPASSAKVDIQAAASSATSHSSSGTTTGLAVSVSSSTSSLTTAHASDNASVATVSVGAALVAAATASALASSSSAAISSASSASTTSSVGASVSRSGVGTALFAVPPALTLGGSECVDLDSAELGNLLQRTQSDERMAGGDSPIMTPTPK